MTVADDDLSRAVSHALRHEPWLYELELDEEGWAPVNQLLAALREKGGVWKSINRSSLEQMLATTAKRRHVLDGDRIRAPYGHSLPGRILKRRLTPPTWLFHGTAPQTWSVIKVEGLLPMGRQFVHLSVDRPTAKAVGRRKSVSPLLLTVNAHDAASAGVTFYEGNDLVWLAERIPARFVAATE